MDPLYKNLGYPKCLPQGTCRIEWVNNNADLNLQPLTFNAIMLYTVLLPEVEAKPYHIFHVNL